MKEMIIPLLIAATIVIILWFLHRQNNQLDITKYTISNSNVYGTVKIAHLSDLHSKPFTAVLQTLNEMQPDMIMITGDYINDKGKRREKMLTFAKSLTEIAPVYYITGNHERRLDDFEVLMQQLKETGFHVLLDETAKITLHNTDIAILGLDENQANFDDYKARKNGTFVYKNVKPLFDSLNSINGFKIVLSHFPENFALVREMNYQQYDFDLQLSGHAHGGQFILPFIGPVLSPGQGLFPKYARGQHGDRPTLIISRGLGNAEFPFRLFNHPEIIEITLSPTTEKKEPSSCM